MRCPAAVETAGHGAHTNGSKEMQYRREGDGTFSPLKERNVEFGGGLERIAADALGVPYVYASVC